MEYQNVFQKLYSNIGAKNSVFYNNTNIFVFGERYSPEYIRINVHVKKTFRICSYSYLALRNYLSHSAQETHKIGNSKVGTNITSCTHKSLYRGGALLRNARLFTIDSLGNTKLCSDD